MISCRTKIGREAGYITIRIVLFIPVSYSGYGFRSNNLVLYIRSLLPLLLHVLTLLFCLVPVRNRSTWWEKRSMYWCKSSLQSGHVYSHANFSTKRFELNQDGIDPVLWCALYGRAWRIFLSKLFLLAIFVVKRQDSSCKIRIQDWTGLFRNWQISGCSL